MGAMQQTAIAHPNLAFVKYWGKRRGRLNLAATDSISLTLDGYRTSTTVGFEAGLEQDVFTLNGERQPAERVTALLDLVRRQAGLRCGARVESRSTVPTAVGLASSSAGFAALSLAACAAAELPTDVARVAELARRGSGSAARSLLGGWVEMRSGAHRDGSDFTVQELATGNPWDVSVVVALTSRQAKRISSTAGMNRTAASSPYYQAWLRTAAADFRKAKRALLDGDFPAFASVAEQNCLKMHASAIASTPPVLYFEPATLAAIRTVWELREGGTGAFFTVDAGPQLKVLCKTEDRPRVEAALRQTAGVLDVIAMSPGPGAWLR